MKNKFEFDYLKDDFKELSGFILENTPNNREEEYFNKILFKIQSHYTNACVFVKEQSNIIDEIAEEFSSLEIKNQKLEFDNQDLNDQIRELDNKLDEYFDKIRELEIELESLR